MLNLVIVEGRLSKAEVKEANGKKFARFDVACEDAGRTDFISFIVWQEKVAEWIGAQKLGTMLSITAAQRNRKYENAEGKTIYVTENVANRVQLLAAVPSKKEADE